jgi:hypothetical protein
VQQRVAAVVQATDALLPRNDRVGVDDGQVDVGEAVAEPERPAPPQERRERRSEVLQPVQ